MSLPYLCTTMSKCYPSGFPSSASDVQQISHEQNDGYAGPVSDGRIEPQVSYHNLFKWAPQTILKIGFQGGTAPQAAAVQKYTQDWITRANANLTLDFAKRPFKEYSIVIGFDPTDGNWSLIGKDSLRRIAFSEPSMNLSTLINGRTEAQWATDIYHEFGHALGLIHEHQTVEAQRFIKWNLANMLQVLARDPNKWTEGQVKRNYTDVIDKNIVNQTGFDRNSIMMYQVPLDFTTNGYSNDENKVLSGLDLLGLGQLYPK